MEYLNCEPKGFCSNNNLALVVVLVGLSVAVYIYNYKAKTANIYPSPSSSPSTPQSDCIPLRFGLKRSSTAALFLQETTKRGYEGIVRKFTGGGKTYFDINTNKLPDKDGPYYVWIANPNDKGRICTAINFGPLVKEPQIGIWQANFDDNTYTDDGAVVVITNGGFGGFSQDELLSLDDPHVILRGFFVQSAHVSGN